MTSSHEVLNATLHQHYACEIVVRPTDSSVLACDAYRQLQSEPHSVFLDSGMPAHGLGRYSIVAAWPSLVMRSRGRKITLLGPHGSVVLDDDPFSVLKTILHHRKRGRPPEGIPFAGGAIGYFAYDLCHFIERLPATAADDLHLPEMYLGFYDSAIVFDQLEGRTWLVGPETERDRIAELQRVIGAAQSPHATRRSPDAARWDSSASAPPGFTCNFTRDQYLDVIRRTKEYIAAGDIFQANISQRFSAPLSVPPFELYSRLRTINPAPFAAFLNFDGITVASASPERFLQVRAETVQTRPIKGTRPRGKTPEEDRALARELLASEKDRAELVMIVDLERNDLGRVCEIGTVKVPELFRLEEYATVYHLVSTVVGRLSPGRDVVDLLRATFPGGSITGAPKIRSMEIIDELEPTRRNVYTGAIGYIDDSGDMDLNIVIRTFIIANGMAHVQVGGGIVADSDPVLEYEETLHKGKALFRALEATL